MIAMQVRRGEDVNECQGTPEKLFQETQGYGIRRQNLIFGNKGSAK
jgi:hypothetical protein